jgi:Protein of unknown function (DUF2867)
VTRARRVAPDGDLLAVDTLADPDYVDAFRVDALEVPGGADPRSAEQWVRAAFEGAPAPVRAVLLVGWRYGLGFRLGPRPSPDHVFGWRIVEATPEVIVLGVESRVLGPAHLVCRVAPAGVVLATFVRFERRGARAVWSVVGLVHRQAQPYLLGRAAGGVFPLHS